MVAIFSVALSASNCSEIAATPYGCSVLPFGLIGLALTVESDACEGLLVVEATPGSVATVAARQGPGSQVQLPWRPAVFRHGAQTM